MSEVAVENINIADILGTEEAQAQVEKVKAALEADPEVSPLVKAAQTVEDVFEIVKRYAKATFAQVKVLFQKAVDYYKETKAALADEVLENVVGGSFSSWWNKWKAVVVSSVVCAACVVGGVVIGAVVGGPAGAVVGAAAGILVGAAAGASVGLALHKDGEKK